MRPAPARLMVLLAALGSGCGPSSFEAFRDQIARASCDRDVKCGLVGASERSRCALPLAVLALVQAGARVDLPAAIKDGRMRFVSAGAQACIDALRDAPCDPAFAEQLLVRYCHNVVQPATVVGERCEGVGECEGGICVAARAGCSGVCVAHPAPGSPCVPGGGPPEATCDPTVQFCGQAVTEAGPGPFQCLRRRPRGEVCSGDSECAFGFICRETCIEPPRLPRGAACDVPGGLCDRDIYCTAAGECAPLRAEGESCDAPRACQRGLACVGFQVDDAGGRTDGQCRPWQDLGSPCTSGPGISGCPHSQRCQAEVCVSDGAARAGHQQPCTHQPCHDGLFCNGLTCDLVVGSGGSCIPGACTDGLSCDAATNTCSEGVACTR